MRTPAAEAAPESSPSEEEASDDLTERMRIELGGCALLGFMDLNKLRKWYVDKGNGDEASVAEYILDETESVATWLEQRGLIPDPDGLANRMSETRELLLENWDRCVWMSPLVRVLYSLPEPTGE